MKRLDTAKTCSGSRWSINGVELWVFRDGRAWRAEVATLIDRTEHYDRWSLRTIAMCRSRSRAINVGMRALARRRREG